MRSRNCLKKMNIRTLGDLTRTTEPQLLASKNFGETSLSEIKEMMHVEGPAAGHGPRGGRPARRTTFAPSRRGRSRQEEQALLDKPISDLNLSVRARKCMNQLGIQTVGDLISADRRRAAGVQELRRDLAQRGPREAAPSWG